MRHRATAAREAAVRSRAQTAVGVFVYDAVFYWLHRLLHTPTLYKRVHKVFMKRLSSARVAR